MNSFRHSNFVIRHSSAILYPLFSILFFLAAGCSKSSIPDQIWLDTGTGPCQVVYPRGIAYSPKDDTIFVVDRMARVQHLDHEGKFLNDWSMPERQNGKPVGLSVGPDENVYVPDTHYFRVIVYTPDGKRDSPDWRIWPGRRAVYLSDGYRLGQKGPHVRQRIRR